MVHLKRIAVFSLRAGFLSLLFSFSAAANVTVKMPFANSMVLQRNMVNTIWGTASGGERISITIGSQTKATTTTSSGAWTIKLDPMAAAGPLTMSIKGNNALTLTDVYIGEVWQVAGQSNMDIRLSYFADFADTIKKADVPLLRYNTLRQPGQTAGGLNPWLVVSPSTAGNLSATGYFFGKEILKTTGVAVGLVVTAVGGTRITEWMDPATLAAKGGAAPTGFAIAGATGNWVWGNATISGDTVIVSSASVASPARVRYAWADNPMFNLFNKEGLPASPFTTESPAIPVAVAREDGVTGPKHLTAVNSGEGEPQRTVSLLGRQFPSASRPAAQIAVSKHAGAQRLPLRPRGL